LEVEKGCGGVLLKKNERAGAIVKARMRLRTSIIITVALIAAAVVVTVVTAMGSGEIAQVPIGKYWAEELPDEYTACIEIMSDSQLRLLNYDMDYLLGRYTILSNENDFSRPISYTASGGKIYAQVVPFTALEMEYGDDHLYGIFGNQVLYTFLRFQFQLPMLSA
jgi:hypothetical protein